MWTFRKIELDDLKQIKLYREAMLTTQSSMDGTNGLHIHQATPRYIKICHANERGHQLPSHLVPSTQFVCVNENNKIVGMCNVRHELNDLLMNFFGHIGYSVHPHYRRKGIATFMLKEALKYCREINIHNALVTCLETNEASRRTILKCGGNYEDTRLMDNDRVERYWFNVREILD